MVFTIPWYTCRQLVVPNTVLSSREFFIAHNVYYPSLTNHSQWGRHYRWSSPVIGHTVRVAPWLTPSHCQHIAVDNSWLISHCLSELMGSIIRHIVSISCPGDSRGTTSGDTGQGEHRWVSSETELHWLKICHCTWRAEYNKIAHKYTIFSITVITPWRACVQSGVK